jgi:hypothetical protein
MVAEGSQVQWLHAVLLQVNGELRDRWSKELQLISMESSAHYDEDKITDDDRVIVEYKRSDMLVSFLISLDDAESHR